MVEADTIFAKATAAGRSGVAIIRISGAEALRACEHFGYNKPPSPRKAILHKFTVGEEFIDSGLIIYFSSPNSFTGEDIVELQMHGGVAITNRVMKELASLPDFRLAMAGEFSQRAFLNQKMDLAEAEGLVDIINAETEMQRMQAARLTQGHASRFFEGLRDRIIEPMALLEAYIDFPEEEIPEDISNQISDSISSIKNDIKYQLSQGQSAERLRAGFVVLLMGKPNSGKSSLLNAIVKRDIAIVSAIPGTTRDMIEASCEISGMPVTIIDTAGLREAVDDIEKQGVARAKEKAKNADIILYLCGESCDEQELQGLATDVPKLVIATKSDLRPAPKFKFDCQVSVETSDGLDEILSAMGEILENKLPASDCFALHNRHQQLLQDALSSLDGFSEGNELEINAEYLRGSAESLSDIIGSHSVDDLLDIIFSSFCIGK